MQFDFKTTQNNTHTHTHKKVKRGPGGKKRQSETRGKQRLIYLILFSLFVSFTNMVSQNGIAFDQLGIGLLWSCSVLVNKRHRQTYIDTRFRLSATNVQNSAIDETERMRLSSSSSWSWSSLLLLLLLSSLLLLLLLSLFGFRWFDSTRALHTFGLRFRISATNVQNSAIDETELTSLCIWIKH